MKILARTWDGAMFLSLLLLALSTTRASTNKPLSATLYSEPLDLYPGQIYETTSSLLALPPKPHQDDPNEDYQMIITGFRTDCVEKSPNAVNDNSKRETEDDFLPVPMSECYLHHLLAMPPSKERASDDTFFFGTGAEAHGTIRWENHSTGARTAFVMRPDEDHLRLQIHAINLRGLGGHEELYRCLECPCHSPRDLNETTGILRKDRYDLDDDDYPGAGCGAALRAEDNTACGIETYRGGLFCCPHLAYCTGQDAKDGPTSRQLSTYYLRLWLEYEFVPISIIGTSIRSIYTAMLDVTADKEHWWGNTEYDIPQLCANSDENNRNDDNCIHKAETILPIIPGPKELTGMAIEVLGIVGHQHLGGLGLSFYLVDNGSTKENGQLLCHSTATYGTGSLTELHNEKGFLVSMSDCFFQEGKAVQLLSNQHVRIISQYDAGIGHHGVMGLGLVYYTTVTIQDEDQWWEMIKSETEHSFPAFLAGILVGSLIVFLFAFYHKRKMARKEAYVVVGQLGVGEDSSISNGGFT